MELTTTERTKGEMSSEVMDEMISEGSEPLATRILGVAIKEEVADVEYIPHKTQKVTKALTGKPMQTRKTIHEKAETEAEVVDLISIFHPVMKLSNLEPFQLSFTYNGGTDLHLQINS